MWVDAEGVCHTVALPNPAELMSEEFRESFDRLIDADAEGVFSIISNAEESFFRDLLGRGDLTSRERGVEGAAPPAKLLRNRVHTLEDLQDCILGVGQQWRLDAIVALDDYTS